MKHALSLLSLVALTACQSVSGASIDVPSLTKAIHESVSIAHDTGMEAVKMEFSVAYGVDGGLDGSAFAVPLTLGAEQSQGTKLVFELKDKAQIRAALEKLDSLADTAAELFEQTAVFNIATGALSID